MKLDSRYADYFQNINVTLEDPWDSWNLCIKWLNLEKYFLISWQIGCSKQASFNINVIFLYTLSIHQMEQRFLFYLMFMIVYIDIPFNILEKHLWTLQERYFMWTSWNMNIGSCQSGFPRWSTIPFQYITLNMILLLWLTICILPQSIRAIFFKLTLSHLVLSSPRLMHIPLISKLISWLGNSMFTTELVLDN